MYIVKSLYGPKVNIMIYYHNNKIATPSNYLIVLCIELCAKPSVVNQMHYNYYFVHTCRQTFIIITNTHTPPLCAPVKADEYNCRYVYSVHSLHKYNF